VELGRICTIAVGYTLGGPLVRPHRAQ
jgi:hypothetical protein